MKRTILLSIFAIVATCTFVACEGEDAPTNKTRGKLNPDAVILIKPADGVRSGEGDTLLSALEVVKRGAAIRLWTKYSGNEEFPEHNGARGFAETQRDTTIPALKMWGTDIIAQGGYLVKEFLYGRDVVITSYENDTIAYVPNAVLTEARINIEKAWADSNYTEVYRLFDEAFKFVPITGKQWKELQKQGKQ